MAKPKIRDQAVSLGDLSEHLGYVLRRAQMAVFQAFIEALRTVDLTPGKYSVLLLIGENPGLPQSAICDALGILKGNFVALLHEFERRGLAERRAGGVDARTNALHLTRKGHNLLRRASALSRALRGAPCTRTGSRPTRAIAIAAARFGADSGKEDVRPRDVRHVGPLASGLDSDRPCGEARSPPNGAPPPRPAQPFSHALSSGDAKHRGLASCGS